MASKIEPNESKAVLISFVYIFCVMAGYTILRPVRDEFAVAMPEGEVENLFVVVFLSMLAIVPIYGFINSRVKLSVLLPFVYVFFALNLAVFAYMLQTNPDSLWTARVYFVWVSVFNLFVVSVFWSFMADLFSKEQSKRLFGFVAAGASTGALTGPTLVWILSDPRDFEQNVLSFLGPTFSFPWDPVSAPFLLLLSATFLLVPIIAIILLARNKSEFQGADKSEDDLQQAIGGNPFAGITLFFKSPYLLGIGIFIILYTFMSTFVWLQLVDLIRAEDMTRPETRALWARLDLIINTLAIFTQLFGTARLAGRFGLVVTLALVPFLTIGGFVIAAAAPFLMVVMVFYVLRRAANFAITRPAREMLFTIVDKESKYKAKNAIDTAVYRGGDAAAAKSFEALESLFSFSGVAIVGAALAAVWFAVSVFLGRSYERRHADETEAVPDKAAEFA